MFKNIKAILDKLAKSKVIFLFRFALYLFFIWLGIEYLFFPEVVDYATFKTVLINKKVHQVYMQENKVWVPKVYNELETFIKEKQSMDDLLDFLKKNNVKLITNPSFFDNWKKLWAWFTLLVGIFGIMIGLYKSDIIIGLYKLRFGKK